MNELVAKAKFLGFDACQQADINHCYNTFGKFFPAQSYDSLFNTVMLDSFTEGKVPQIAEGVNAGKLDTLNNHLIPYIIDALKLRMSIKGTILSELEKLAPEEEEPVPSALALISRLTEIDIFILLSKCMSRDKQMLLAEQIAATESPFPFAFMESGNNGEMNLNILPLSFCTLIKNKDKPTVCVLATTSVDTNDRHNILTNIQSIDESRCSKELGVLGQNCATLSMNQHYNTIFSSFSTFANKEILNLVLKLLYCVDIAFVFTTTNDYDKNGDPITELKQILDISTSAQL